jgi:hypothetical protein
MVVLYLLDVDPRDLQQVVGKLGVQGRIRLTRRIDQADAVLAMRTSLKQSGWLKKAARSSAVPIYALKNQTHSNLSKALRVLLGIDPSAGGQFQKAKKKAIAMADQVPLPSASLVPTGDLAPREGSMDDWYSSSTDEDNDTPPPPAPPTPSAASAGEVPEDDQVMEEREVDDDTEDKLLRENPYLAAAVDAATEVVPEEEEENGDSDSTPSSSASSGEMRSAEEIWAQITGKPKGFGRPPRAVLEALDEAKTAIEDIVLRRNQPMELLPRPQDVLRVQAALVHEYGLVCEQIGKGPAARIRVLAARTENVAQDAA